MSRKILSALIAAFLLLSLCSCGGGSKPADDSSSAVSGGNRDRQRRIGRNRTGFRDYHASRIGIEFFHESGCVRWKPWDDDRRARNGSGATKTQTVVTVPTKTSDSAQMVDPGFLNGVDPFKDPGIQRTGYGFKGQNNQAGDFLAQQLQGQQQRSNRPGERQGNRRDSERIQVYHQSGQFGCK